MAERAQHFYQRGDILKAKTFFSQSLKIFPNDELALYQRALCYHKLKDYQLAQKDLDRAIKIRPNYIDALLGKIMIGIQENNYESVTQHSEHILNFDPEYIDAYYYKALSMELRGNIAAAIKGYDDVIKRSTRHRKTLLRRAPLHYRNGQFEYAIFDYCGALQIDLTSTMNQNLRDFFLKILRAHPRFMPNQRSDDLDIYNSLMNLAHSMLILDSELIFNSHYLKLSLNEIQKFPEFVQKYLRTDPTFVSRKIKMSQFQPIKEGDRDSRPEPDQNHEYLEYTIDWDKENSYKSADDEDLDPQIYDQIWRD